MAANEYYTEHPQNSTQTDLPQADQGKKDSCEPYRQTASPNNLHTFSQSESNSSTSLPSNRGFLTPYSKEQESRLKKPKSERALKFVEKQIKKKIEKKLNHGVHSMDGSSMSMRLWRRNRVLAVGNMDMEMELVDIYPLRECPGMRLMEEGISSGLEVVEVVDGWGIWI
ncbi:hypothetical protein GQ44DRAFT_768315 [Phaeosphaeriaceae sp. PMI808]|nr:hypothetical protein GQ44DRAFT_768315 [Phaeosphaeriaceae sp. PMI808]